MPSHTHTAIAAPAPPTRALARLVSSSQGMAGLAWHGMVWLGVRSRYFHSEVRWYLPTQNLKINSELFVKFLQLPLQGPAKALGENLEGGCSIFLQKSFILGRHIYWIFRLLRGGRLGCTRASVKWHLWPYQLDFSLWSNAIRKPTLPLQPPPPPRARSLASSRQAKAWLAWLGMVWYGLASDPGTFIMKCGGTCRHNI